MLLKKKQYGYLDMVSLPFKIGPFYAIAEAAQTISSALLPTAQIFITAYFINTAIAVYQGDAVFSNLYMPIALLSINMVYGLFIGAVMNVFDTYREAHFRNKLMPALLEKWARLQYRHIEDSKVQDLYSRIDYQPAIQMYQRVINLVNFSVFVLGIIITLFTQVWWIALTMLAASVPLLYISTKAGKEGYAASREMTQLMRKNYYLSQVLMGREAVEERSIFGYSKALNDEYIEKFEFARKYNFNIARKFFIRSKIGGVFGLMYAVIAVLALLNPVINGTIDIGMFIALIAAIIGLAERLSWGIQWQIQDIARLREYLKDLTEFVNLEEDVNAVALPDKNMTFDEIEFKNVCFKYPQTEKLVLNNVSFIIKRGKHYSFVGENGAGKTTIIKLLTGLYSNYEGEILVDGFPLRELSQEKIKGLTSVVYQDFARYQISLYDNIAIADINSPNNRDDVSKALTSAGMAEAIEKLNNGMDTPLGKIIENGVDLSGGEWQRVALARSIMSSAPLKILDEPTSALDPIAESAVYHNFERISQGKTTIFISHRLGSTKLADVIFVLAEGKIAESGTHTELIATNGLYAKMFKSQAGWYATEGDVVYG